MIPHIAVSERPIRRRAPVRPAADADAILLADMYRQALLDPSTATDKLRLLGELQQAGLAHTARAAYASALIELQRAFADHCRGRPHPG